MHCFGQLLVFLDCENLTVAKEKYRWQSKIFLRCIVCKLVVYRYFLKSIFVDLFLKSALVILFYYFVLVHLENILKTILLSITTLYAQSTHNIIAQDEESILLLQKNQQMIHAYCLATFYTIFRQHLCSIKRLEKIFCRQFTSILRRCSMLWKCAESCQ